MAFSTNSGEWLDPNVTLSGDLMRIIDDLPTLDELLQQQQGQQEEQAAEIDRILHNPEES